MCIKRVLPGVLNDAVYRRQNCSLPSLFFYFLKSRFVLTSRQSGCGAVAALAPSGRLNTMFSAISIGKFLTSALFSDSDRISPPLSAETCTILLILKPRSNVQKFAFSCLFNVPSGSADDLQIRFLLFHLKSTNYVESSRCFQGQAGGTSPNKSHYKALSFC